MYFRVNGKGNAKGLTMGQRVSYTEMSNAKGVFAENIKPIEGVCVCARARSCVFKKEQG